MGVLTVRTTDDRGALTGTRVQLTAADGKLYAPGDAYARVSLAGDRLFHTTGEFRVDVPAGNVRLTVVKGFEFEPKTIQVDVRADALTNATVSLARLTDLSARGWNNGSTHVHM